MVQGLTYKAPLALPSLSGAELVAHAWSDDEIDCYDFAPPPGGPWYGPCTGHLFDMRLRQWYTISTEHYKIHVAPSGNELEDTYWFDILKKAGHRGREDFNHIDVDPANGDLTFSLLPTDFHRQCSSLLQLHPPPSHPIHPHIHFSALEDRKYLNHSVESCTWEGEPHVLKQPLLAPDIAGFDTEIAMNGRLAYSPYIIHIVAYIVDDDDHLRGILLPWAGIPIDHVPSVRWSYFRDVAHGLKDIHSLTMSNSTHPEGLHGNVCCRHILVNGGIARLIDVRNEGLDYVGDTEAFADVIRKLKDKARGEEDRNKMDELETWLRAGMGFAEVVSKMKDW